MSAGGGRQGALGAFDTDAAALRRRIQAHERYGSRDLNPWVLEHLELEHDQRVLELGCGTGKQTLPIAHAVGPNGRVLAIDVSGEALAELERQAVDMGVDGRMELSQSSFDDLAGAPWREEFDRAVSCYALYYAERPGPLLEAIHRSLRPGGMLFFCGPAGANNAELKEFCDRLRGGPEPDQDRAKVFMEKVGVQAARALFEDVELLEFENPLRFDSADALIEYWTSYNLYDPAIEDRFREAADRHFAGEPEFQTVKRVRGVRATRA